MWLGTKMPAIEHTGYPTGLLDALDVLPVDPLAYACAYELALLRGPRLLRCQISSSIAESVS